MRINVGVIWIFVVKFSIGSWPIVLKKSDGNFYGGFSVASTAQLRRVRAMVAVLHSRVTDLSFPADTRTEFFNTIDRSRTVKTTYCNVLFEPA
jgi:hypothetical protein